MFDALFRLYLRFRPVGEQVKGRFKHGHAPVMQQTTLRFVRAALNPKL
jgi:hypothetical protein